MFEKRVKGGAKRKHTLGEWPGAVSLSEARAMAIEIEAEAVRGIDRVAEKRSRQEKEAEIKAETVSVRQAIEIYDSLHLSNLRTGAERKRQLEQSLAEYLASPVQQLSKQDLQKAIDAKLQAGRKAYANRIRAALKAFSNWLWQRGYLGVHVGASLPRAARETPRDRVLSLREVREIWKSSAMLTAPWGTIVRLLVLTAQRRGEILALQRTEVDLGARRIVKPGSSTKNKKPHITHLSEPAVRELSFLLAEAKESPYVFTTTGNTPVSGIGKAKKKLDQVLGEDFEPWRLHDLRTAFATAMAEAGVPEVVADRVLNHAASSSSPSTVARVYNMADQLDQRAEALDLWAELVTNDDELEF